MCNPNAKHSVNKDILLAPTFASVFKFFFVFWPLQNYFFPICEQNSDTVFRYFAYSSDATFNYLVYRTLQCDKLEISEPNSTNYYAFSSLTFLAHDEKDGP